MLALILAIENEYQRNFVGDVYLKYSDRLYNKALAIVNNHHDAEDCAHDVFKCFMDYAHLCCEWDEAHIKNFLMKAIRCRSINKYKENMRRQANECSISDVEDGEEDMDFPDPYENVELAVITQEKIDRIAEIIDSMDPMYGDILYFRYQMGMSNIEISKRFNIPVNTVNQRISRARKMMLEELGEI